MLTEGATDGSKRFVFGIWMVTTVLHLALIVPHDLFRLCLTKAVIAQLTGEPKARLVARAVP